MAESVLDKLIADKYRLETLLREGGEGDLYAGRHEVMDKAVTIKVLPRALGVDARWTKRFVDEARAASAVTHANVLNITDFGTDAKGMSYAVFEQAPEKTLKDILADGPALDEKRALDIASQIAAGIAAAHVRKVVHGRLAPDSIFVNVSDDAGDEVKTYGFGRDPMTPPQDADPRYLAPEQLKAYPVADGRSDVYSLGVILYGMLTGVVPYEGASAADVQKKQEDPPPPLSAFRKDLNPEIEPIILSAVAIEPEHRYQTMAAFAEDLDLLSTRLNAPKAAAAVAGGNAWRAAFVVLAGVAILSAALIYATSVRQTDPTAQLQADAGSLPVQPIGPASGLAEETLARRPVMTDDEIKAAMNANTALAADQLPGGDGFNAWASGGPPLGAPPAQYIPPGQGTVTIDPSGGSQFMPQELPPGCTMLPSGVVLCPKPVNPGDAAKPSPTPKTPAANTTTGQPTPTPATTQKPMATPIPKATKSDPKKKPEEI